MLVTCRFAANLQAYQSAIFSPSLFAKSAIINAPLIGR
jgi:hypothetical protein